MCILIQGMLFVRKYSTINTMRAEIKTFVQSRNTYNFFSYKQSWRKTKLQIPNITSLSFYVDMRLIISKKGKKNDYIFSK